MATLTGDSTSQTLTGSTANDTLYGAGGNDTLIGGAGNDLYKYYLGTGNDTIKDSSGTDTLLLDDPSGMYADWEFYRSADNSDLIISFGSAGSVTIDNQFSNSSSLVINKLMVPDDDDGYMSINLTSGTSGTSGSDFIVGKSSSESISGGLGDDIIFGSAGNDTINGGNGYNSLYGGTGNDSLIGGIEEDSFSGGNGSDTINGGSGWDYAGYGEQSAGIIANFSGTVKTIGSVSLASQTVYEKAYATTDTLIQINRIDGTSYSDAYYGGATSTEDGGGFGFEGYQGNDTIYSGAANSWMMVGYDCSPNGVIINLSNTAITVGNKTVAAYTTQDGWGYTDTFKLTSGSNIGISGSDNADYMVAQSNGGYLNGNDGNDTLVGSSGNNQLRGDSGNDVFYSSSIGYHQIDGGDDIDTVSYIKATSGVSVSLATSSSQAVGSGYDSLSSIEHLIGSNYADTLTGNSSANRLDGGLMNDKLFGSSGNDTLLGGSGNDTLIGGSGMDSLTGGTGSDIFDFNSLSEMTISGSTTDVISDFTHGTDKIDLSTLDANTTTTTNDTFAATFVSSFTQAGQLMYSNGVLYGNTDGDSTAEFAIHLTGTPTVTASDFVL